MAAHPYIAQLEKQYIPYLKSSIMGLPFEPIVLRGGKNKPETTALLHEQTRLFQENEKTADRKGWTIEWEEWSSKKLGKQQWPAAVRVSTAADFLFLIKKEKEVIAFTQQLQQLLQWRPLIKEWLAARPRQVLDLQSDWLGICAVVDYLLVNDVSRHYLRSIPVPVHTKFIEQNSRTIHSLLQFLDNQKFPAPDLNLDEALQVVKKPFFFTLRWLEEALAIQYSAGMEVFKATAGYLQKQQWIIKRVILVENETNLYLFTAMPGTLVACSHGMALHLLKDIPLFNTIQLYYWGDMDEKGFEMLNDMRKYYPTVVSLFMDEATLLQHQAELDTKPATYLHKQFPLLQPHESAAYQYLLPKNQWLEQERLQQLYVQDKLQSLPERPSPAE